MPAEEVCPPEPSSLRGFIKRRNAFKLESEKNCSQKTKQVFRLIVKLLKTRLGLTALLIIYSFLGATLFQHIEGPQERRERENFLRKRNETLKKFVNLTEYYKRNSSAILEELFDKVMEDYETLILAANKAGVDIGNKGKLTWDFYGALFFSGTVYTTIGYGHITPKTPLGQLATIIYALIGIPLCLVVLADVGKLLAKLTKYLWLSCKNTVKRKRQEIKRRIPNDTQAKIAVPGLTLANAVGLKVSHKNETAEEDCDEHAVPPLLPVVIVMIYLALGGQLYRSWEKWSYLESLYFVFVSMSTIGFGDIVPDHPKIFMASFLYLLLGLSLVAMTVNIIMKYIKFTIHQASEKAAEITEKITDEVESNLHKMSELAIRRLQKKDSHKNIEINVLPDDTSVSAKLKRTTQAIINENRRDRETIKEEEEEEPRVVTSRAEPPHLERCNSIEDLPEYVLEQLASGVEQHYDGMLLSPVSLLSDRKFSQDSGIENISSVSGNSSPNSNNSSDVTTENCNNNNNNNNPTIPYISDMYQTIRKEYCKSEGGFSSSDVT